MMTVPRCSAHRARPEIPPTCAICQRIALEKTVVEKTVDVLLSAGYALATNQGDGTDANVPYIPTRDRAEILKELMEVDDEFLGVFDMATVESPAAPTAEDPNPPARRRDGGPLPFAWVRFVYGNDGWDVISDYTTNLDAVLRPVNAYCHEVEP